MIFLANINRNNKTIIISEEQQHEIMQEAADETFATNDINMPKDKSNWDERAFYNMVRYCEQHCGEEIGCGSSRAVYQIDDNKVLKLAVNPKGVAQNNAEAKVYSQYKGYSLFPQIYNCSPDGLWLVSEFVLPAEIGDFDECVGLDWNDFCEIVKLIDEKQKNSPIWQNYKYPREQVENAMNEFPIIREVHDYMINSDAPSGDIVGIKNWGLAMRNGNPIPVLLDSGLTNQIWDDYYKR